MTSETTATWLSPPSPSNNEGVRAETFATSGPDRNKTALGRQGQLMEKTKLQFTHFATAATP
jgi:hypothetical protein